MKEYEENLIESICIMLLVIEATIFLVTSCGYAIYWLPIEGIKDIVLRISSPAGLGATAIIYYLAYNSDLK